MSELLSEMSQVLQDFAYGKYNTGNLNTLERCNWEASEIFAKVLKHRLDKETLQKQVTDYVREVRHMPLVEGQLVSMVILHFDIPDKEAEVMVDKALHRLDRPELTNTILTLLDLLFKKHNYSYSQWIADECADQLLLLHPDEEAIKHQVLDSMEKGYLPSESSAFSGTAIRMLTEEAWQALKKGE